MQMHQRHLLHQPQSPKQLPGQSVFRLHTIPLNHPVNVPGKWTTNPPAGAGNVFRPRKTHTKSRSGCRACKARRIKCDESRDGGCTKCRNHGLECDYLKSQPRTQKGLFELRVKPKSKAESKTESSIQSVCSLPVSGPSSVPSPLPPSLSVQLDLPISTHYNKNITAPLTILHHFSSLTSYTCGSPQGQVIIQSCILGLAMRTPYLMHALLGVAATHMSQLLPADVNAIQHTRHKLADAYHWGQALKLFRQELCRGAAESNMDALLSTIMLVAIYQFVLREEDVQSPSSTEPSQHQGWKRSFVFVEDADQREAALKWLTIQAGFKMLLSQLSRYLRQSVWMPVFSDAALQPNPEGESVGKTWEDVPPAGKIDEVESLFCHLCCIDENSTESNNPYYASLEIVLHARRMRPITVHHFNKMVTFMGRITVAFRELLVDRDSAALAILAHWLSLLTGVRQWWLTGRAEQECRAIVLFLKQRSVYQHDANLRTLLYEPGEVIGVEI